MSNLRESATLTTDEGRELPVTANLHKGSAGLHTVWSGTLSVPAHERSTELLNLRQGRLRFENGQEAAFIRPDTSDWRGSPAGLFQITIEGNGDAPF
ncbi:hypothetical protein ACFYWY_27430 [Streptomyces sp. NPDC002870]|uniref:hypothetical protein n=1 Tax=Streptomyces sp. NPDC002870 TaxID=3364666 RepID=UPI00369AB35A